MNRNPDSPPCVDQLVQSVLAVDPSPEFEGQIRTRVRGEALRRRKTLRSMALFSGFAAAMVILIVAVILRNESSRVEPVASRESSTVTADEIPLPEIPPAVSRQMLTVETSETAVVVAASEPTESLAPPRIEEFSLETNPLTAMTLPPVRSLPAFEIQPFSLSSPNEGVAE